jgi:hypothetical protein
MPNIALLKNRLSLTYFVLPRPKTQAHKHNLKPKKKKTKIKGEKHLNLLKNTKNLNEDSKTDQIKLK